MGTIDFHTHTFEDHIAFKAVDKLRRSANIRNYTDGTDSGLMKADSDNDISLSVVLPVATRIMQANAINARSVKKNELSSETGLIYFAAIHPEDTNILSMLGNIKKAGFKGIKIHPVAQDVRMDDIMYLRILDIASELDLITVVHAGEDISFPGNDKSSLKYILKAIDIVKPAKFVLAHMGGFNEWDMVESDLAGADVYLDTSFSINKIIPFDDKLPSCNSVLALSKFVRIVRKHGADKILFGSDSPWTSQRVSVQNVINSGLTEEEINLILEGNAHRLLFG